MITYSIYTDSATGAVDYSTPVATTSSLTVTLSAVPIGTSTIFAIRATDTATGIEEENTDARVVVSVAADGTDTTGRPLPVAGLRASATAGGTALIEWGWPHLPSDGLPVGFHVYLGTGSIDYTAPVATAPYLGTRAGLTAFRCTLAGLVDGAAYVVSVRAFNAAGEEDNVFVAAFSADATPPNDVVSLIATPGF